MGLNDDQLTPFEHDDMRSRLLAGTKRIKPVGAHHRTIATTTVAVAVIAVLSVGAIGAANFLRMGDQGAPISTPTSSSTPSSSPTPSPTSADMHTATPPPAATPAVAFGGDCGLVLTDEEVSSALGVPGTLWDDSAHFGTGSGSSAALLGGVMCGWHGENGEYAGASVLDATAVPDSVKSAYATLQCGGTSAVCEMGAVIGDVWVGAGLGPDLDDPWMDMTDSQMAQEQARVQAVINEIVAKLVPGTAIATPRAADWWTLPRCETLSSTVATTVGEPLTMGFPGDSIPDGMDWDILVASGMDDWCSWYNTIESSSTIVELYPQPGVGRPSEAALAAPDVRTTGVDGADEAWIQVDPQHPSTAYVVATSGPNRLTIRFSSDDPARITDVAAAVLAQLG